MSRPKGCAKTPGSGRKKGTPNKILKKVPAVLASERQAIHDAVEAAVAANQTPLEYMLSVYRDPNAELHRRDQMATAAAPYIHPRLAAQTKRDGEDLPQNALSPADYRAWAREQIRAAFGLPPLTIEHHANGKDEHGPSD